MKNFLILLLSALSAVALALDTSATTRASETTLTGTVSILEDVAVLVADNGFDYVLEGGMFLDGDVVRLTGVVEELESGVLMLHVIDMEIIDTTDNPGERISLLTPLRALKPSA